MALSMSSASALALLPWRAIGFGEMISFNDRIRYNTPKGIPLGVFCYVTIQVTYESFLYLFYDAKIIFKMNKIVI